MSDDYSKISNIIIHFFLSKISVSLLLNHINQPRYDVFNVNIKINYKLEDYVNYIVSVFKLEENTLFYSLILIQKFLNKNTDFQVTYSNVFKIFFTSVYLSSKLLEDVNYSHQEFSKFSGFKTTIISIMESEFMEMMDYNVIFYNENNQSFHEFKSNL